MATRHLTRSLLTTKQSLPSALSHSCAVASSSAVLPGPSSFLFRLRPLAAAASASYIGRRVPAFSARAFSTRQTSSSLSDPNPNWSNRPPKETILLDGCDFEHWLVVVEKPEGDPTRDEIIDSYIKTLAMVIGSEEEARMKIYSVSTRHYYAFGALVSEELSYKLKELPKVRWVLPDSYLDVRNKDYGGEPFINGQAVPYDPKYHEEWVRNNARANERNRRNDRPRNFDRSRNFERRREMQNSGGPGGPPPNAPNPVPNYGGGAPPSNPGNNPANNYGGGAPPNMALPTNAPPNLGPNIGGQSSYGGGAPPPPNYPTNNMRPPTNNPYGPGPNNGGAPNPYGPGPNNGGAPNPYGPGPNNGGAPFQGQHGGGSGSPYQSHNYPAQNSGNFAPNAGYGPGPSQNGFAPNMGPGQNQY